MKPAVYRIWYGYHVEPDITDMILPKYQYLHEIVRKGRKAPMKCISHVLFRTLSLCILRFSFASWLHREGKLIQVREKREGRGGVYQWTHRIAVSLCVSVRASA